MQYRGTFFTFVTLNAVYTKKDETFLRSHDPDIYSNIGLNSFLTREDISWRYRFNADPDAFHTEQMFFSAFLNVEGNFCNALDIIDR